MPHVAALYAGLVGILLIVLAAAVSKLRRRFGIGLGDGGNPALARAIRVHGNAVEWALPAILLLLIAELTRASPLLLHACGIATIAGRTLHAIGLSQHSGYSFGRFAGSAASWLALLVLSIWNVWAFLRVALV
jgi:uncharacterized membrane protein YecN with MAPEG domain